MRKVFFFAVIAAVSLFFVSCTNNEPDSKKLVGYWINLNDDGSISEFDLHSINPDKYPVGYFTHFVFSFSATKCNAAETAGSIYKDGKLIVSDKDYQTLTDIEDGDPYVFENNKLTITDEEDFANASVTFPDNDHMTIDWGRKKLDYWKRVSIEKK